MTASILKQVTAWTVLVSQLGYPLAVTAEPYFKVYIPGLRVSSGKPLPETNFDPSNPSVTDSTAGSAILRVAPSKIEVPGTRITQESRWHTTRLSNVGAVPLTVGTTASESHEFIHTDHCDGVLLKPLESCDFNVKFKPTQIVGDLSESRVVIPFEGDGAFANAHLRVGGKALPATDPVGADLIGEEVIKTSGSVARWSLKFPVLVVNDPPEQKTFKVVNTKDSVLEFRGLEVRQNENNFKASSDCLSVIRPGDFCTVTVSFQPLTEGVKGAVVVVQTNSHDGNNKELDVTGEGLDLYPAIDTSKSTLAVDFGEKPVSTGPHSFIVTLQNSGRLAMNVDNVTLGGAVTTGLSVTNDTCKGKEVAALGGKCTLTVNWTGSALSELDAYIRVVHNGRLAPLSPTDIPIKGKAVPQTRLLEVSMVGPTSITMNVGDSSDIRTVNVENIGNMPVSNPGLSFTRSGVLSTVSSTCANPLAVGAKCTIGIRPAMTTAGDYSLEMSGAGSSLTAVTNKVPLTVRAELRRITATPFSSLSLGLRTTNYWTTAQTYLITNTGSVRVAPMLEEQKAPILLKVGKNTCAAGVEPGDMCELELQVKPQTTSSVSATVRLLADKDYTGANVLSHSLTMQGTPQSYTYTPESLDFGNIYSLTPVTKTITVTNTAEQTALTGLTLTAPSWNAPAGWGAASVTHTCGTSVPAGGTCEINVTLSPKAYLKEPVALSSPVRGLQMRFSGADSVNKNIVTTATLNGTSVEVVDTDLNFDSVPYGVTMQDSPRRVLLLRNTGDHPALYLSMTRTAGTVTVVPEATSSCLTGPIPAKGTCELRLVLNEPEPVDTGIRKSTYGVNLESAGASVFLEIPQITVNTQAIRVLAPSEPLDFGVLPEHVTNTKTFQFTVEGEGSAARFVSATSSDPRFSITSVTCSHTASSVYQQLIPAGSVCSVTVGHTARVAPAAQTLAEISLTFKEAGVNKVKATVPVKVVHEQISYEILFNGLDFGTLPSLAASSYQYALVKNTSERAPIVTSSPTPAWLITQGPFSFSSSSATRTIEGADYTSCTFHRVIAPGATCYVEMLVTSSPGNVKAVGPISFDLPITTAHLTPVTIPVKAFFEAPSLKLSETSVNYGTLFSASSPVETTIKLTNSGKGHAQLGIISLSNIKGGSSVLMLPNGGTSTTLNTRYTGAHETYGVKNCAAVVATILPAGDFCNVYVRYTPTGAAYSGVVADLTVNSVDSQNRAVKTVFTADVKTGAVKVDAAGGLQFGRMLTASTATREFNVTNEGSGALLISNIGVPASLRFPDYIKVTHDCPQWLGAGSSCKVTVSVTPAVNEVFNGQLESVTIASNSGGASTNTVVPLRGESYGALLTPTDELMSMGMIDQHAALPPEYSKVVTYTSSGEAPVLITDVRKYVSLGTTAVFKVAGGSCEAGMWLQPAQSCTLEFTNVTNTAGTYAGGTRMFPVGPHTTNALKVMAIQGHQTEVNSVLPKHANEARMGATAQITSPVTITSVWPRGVFTTEALTGSVRTSSVRENPLVTVNSVPLKEVSAETASLVTFSAKEAALAMPSGGSTLLTIKNSEGISVPASIELHASSEPYFFGEEAQVTTHYADRDTSTKIENKVSAVISPGVVAVIGTDSVVKLLTNQQEIARVALPAAKPAVNSGTLTPTFAVSYKDGLLYVVRGVVQNQFAAYSDNYRAEYTQAFVLNVTSNSLSLAATLPQIQSISGTNHTFYAPSALGRIDIEHQGLGIDGDANNMVVFTSYEVIRPRVDASNPREVRTAHSIAYIYSRNGNSWSFVNSFNLPYLGSEGAQGGGVSMVDGVVYLRKGDSITSHYINGTSLVEDTRYTYQGSMANTTANGMTSSRVNGVVELFVPCYADTVVCRVNVNQGALGTAVPFAGTAGTAGYRDGSYQNSIMAIDSLGAHYKGASLIQKGIPAAVRGIQR